MMKNFIRRLFTNFFFLFIAAAILAASTNVWGQCEKTNEKSAFSTVSNEYKEKLLQRFEMFLRNKCEENFDALYEMLTSSFRQLNKKEDFLKDMKSYYSGKDRFVSFNPKMIGESLSPKDNKPSVWFIEGCLTEVINGKKRSVKTILEAIREDKEIFFTDITTRPNPLGGEFRADGVTFWNSAWPPADVEKLRAEGARQRVGMSDYGFSPSNPGANLSDPKIVGPRKPSPPNRRRIIGPEY